MSDRARVGVVGCGLIAQVMHLPYLAELSDRFELTALCDMRVDLASACAERYGQPRVHARWQDLLAEDLDAVVIATSGDHAPIAIAAAAARACICWWRSRWRSAAVTAPRCWRPPSAPGCV